VIDHKALIGTGIDKFECGTELMRIGEKIIGVPSLPDFPNSANEIFAEHVFRILGLENLSKSQQLAVTGPGIQQFIQVVLCQFYPSNYPQDPRMAVAQFE
jgi:alpha-D-ribose 1-methylphosphonate 5-triphosphate synthase subunit PhnH